MAIDIDETIRSLERNGGLFEVCEVHSFEGYRDTDSGQPQTVYVRIFDAGQSAGDMRYAVEARTEDGKLTRGNEAESVDVALAITRWNELG